MSWHESSGSFYSLIIPFRSQSWNSSKLFWFAAILITVLNFYYCLGGGGFQTILEKATRSKSRQNDTIAEIKGIFAAVVVNFVTSLNIERRNIL